MKTSKLILAFFMQVLFLQLLSAQEATWAWAKQSIGLGDENVSFNSIIQDSDGNFIFKGTYNDEFSFENQTFDPLGGMFNDAFLAKVNSQGDLIWLKTYGSPGLIFFFINGLVTDSQNNIYLTFNLLGSTIPYDIGNDVVLEVEPETNPSFIVKLNPDGVPQWSKRFGGSLNQSVYNSTLDIYQDTLVFGGAFISNIDFDGYTAFALQNGIDVFVAKLDLDGNTHWLTTIGGNLSEQSLKVATNALGEIFTCIEWEGDTLFAQDQFIVNDMPTFVQFGGNADRAIIKYNAVGEVAWIRKEATEEAEYGGVVYSSPDGGVAVASTSAIDITIGDVEVPAGASIVSKYSSSGSVEYVKYCTGSEFFQTPTLAIDNDNNIYLALQFNSNEIAIQGTSVVNSAGSNGTDDIALIKLDDSGTLQWAFSIGGAESETIGDLLALNDGSLVINGAYSSQILELGSFTLNNNQELTTNFFLAEFDVLSSISEMNSNISAKLFPNPCNNQFNVDLTSFAGKEVNIRLTSLEGKIISEDQLFVNSTIFSKNINNLSSGVYFLEIKSDTDYSMKKISIQH